MYTDTILFIVGGLCGLLALALIGYLIASGRKSRSYRTILQQETERFDALTTTAQLTKSAKPQAAPSDGTELLAGRRTAPERGTSLLFEDDRTEILREEQPEAIDFDASALEGRYILKREIHGGGMSRVFLAESAKLGNQWIVKFVSNRAGELMSEEHILKLLNHISLPKIIDIFHDDKGVYLVESYIEGVSLDQLLESGQRVNQAVLLDWAEQLAQVLNYLHRLEPHPIHHFDLKPSNIMVTHDNRLVLIDFGISKRFGEDDQAAVGVTYRYAAPEQLKHHIPEKHRAVVESRFGELPADRIYWNPDARTDLYSLGAVLFELATGGIPTARNIGTLKDAVSHELCAILQKCLAVDPAARYQSAEELLAALQQVKGSKVKMARTLFMRKLASVSTVCALVLSGGSLGGGYYLYGQERHALLNVEPEIVTVSLQQSSAMQVEKRMPNGSVVLLDNALIRWNYSQNNVARIDGNRILGMNVGRTVLDGLYRNKEITLNVRVVEPMDGLIDISQRYRPGHTVSVLSGSARRDHTDGALSDAEFVSPESIAVADDGTVYVADSGLLRKIKDGKVESIAFEPDFLTPNIVRTYQNALYTLTHQWEDADGVYYGIIKLTDQGAEGLYLSDAKFTAIEDFTFGADGLLYFIDRNAGVGEVYLKTLDPKNTDDIRTLCTLPDGTASLAAGDGAIYLANPETGAIQVWQGGSLRFFAGVEHERAFIDGAAPLFYMPQKLKYSDGFLYVWDFNVLRRVGIENGVATDCITIAGEASPTFALEDYARVQAADEIILPNGNLTDFAVLSDRILLTDPKRGVLWQVK